jgi:hypothetical protein
MIFTDLESAKAASGTRLVVSSLVPSPWSEAAKGCLRLAGIAALVVRRGLDKTEIDAWTGIDNVPAVLHDREPVRANWASIVAFADRTGTARILPAAPAERADVMGTLHEIAGEDGIGWNGRLAMIEAGLASEGARGFPLPVSKFLAKRYSHRPGIPGVHDRIAAQLAFVAGKLRGDYFGGAVPNALDVYSATFLTPIAAPISEAECPQLDARFRAAFATAHEAFGDLVPRALMAHRERMFAQHLPRPIEL